MSTPVGLIALWCSVLGLYALGGRSWYVTAFATIGVLAPVILCLSYFAYRKRYLDSLKRFSSDECVFRFSDDGVEVVSSLGESRFKWQVVEKIWRFPEVWLLFFSKHHYTTLPLDDLTPELRDFISKKVSDNGGEIR
jgi:hypothetical protein